MGKIQKSTKLQKQQNCTKNQHIYRHAQIQKIKTKNTKIQKCQI